MNAQREIACVCGVGPWLATDCGGRCEACGGTLVWVEPATAEPRDHLADVEREREGFGGGPPLTAEQAAEIYRSEAA